jgi:hypothetical protein
MGDVTPTSRSVGGTSVPGSEALTGAEDEAGLGMGPMDGPGDMEGMDGDDMEGVYDEAHELALIREFGGHPLMQRVQEALLGQLKQTHTRLTEELRVNKEDLNRTDQKRETVGVELYGQQQQLARLQLMLENTHEAFSKCSQERARIEVSRQTAVHGCTNSADVTTRTFGACRRSWRSSGRRTSPGRRRWRRRRLNCSRTRRNWTPSTRRCTRCIPQTALAIAKEDLD